jgi:glutaredoxin
MAVLLALLVASTALSEAETHLRAGRLDKVGSVLEPSEAVPDGERPAAAELLLDAAELARARNDRPLALFLAQQALRRDATSDRALRTLTGWAREERDYPAAVRYACRWVAARPDGEEPKRALAQLKALERDFKPIEIVSLKPRARHRSGPALARSDDAAGETAVSARRSGARVTLYGVSWCGACRAARRWLQAKGIAFDDRDIETDMAAARELNVRQEQQGQYGGGVPVIAVGDRLLPPGFDPASIERALAK